MPAPPPPFRGLSPYTESDDDAESFFGRDAEIEIAAANLLAARLTLLYGPSGVGKTSLVRAGLVHRLRRTPEPLPDSGRRRQAVIVLSEWRTDPIAELAHHARRHAGPSEGGRPTASGAARAMTPTDALRPLADAGDAELLLVFDQFDEYLTSHPRGGPLEEVLPALLRMHDLPVRVLISLREDALAGLDRFKGDIPGLFDNYLRLDHLDRDAAREAIERPIERYNARASDPIVLERGLAGDVLDELAAGDVNIVRRGAPVTSSGRDGSDRIEPAYLQLVMTRLWETELHSGSAELRRSTLAELGGAGRIVQTHLRSTMDALTTRERRLAFQLLHLLVTPSGMKVRHTPRDLAAYVAAPEPEVDRLLIALARQDRRVLRAAPPPPGSEASTAYEIFHDVLAGAVLDWRTDYQARERRRLERRTRRLRAALAAVSAATVAVALYAVDPEWIRRLELRSVDLRFAVRGTQEPDRRLILVAVDDRTLERFDRRRIGILPRGQHARLLRRVHADRPGVIALDVIFLGRREPAGDRALLAAIRRTRDRLVLPFGVDYEVRVRTDGSGAVVPNLLGRPRAIEETGVRTAFPGLPEDVDDVNRRADYFVLIEQVDPDGSASAHPVQTFALAAADVVRRGALWDRVEDLPTAPRRAEGGQSEGTTWIDYRAPPGSLRTVSALDVLAGRVPRGTFRDAHVVIGVTANAQDVQRTPLDEGRGRSGPEVQASALSTMLRDFPLRDASRMVDIVAIVTLAVIPALAALTRSRRVLAVAAGAAAVLFAIFVQVAFHAGWIISAVVPLLALAAGLAGVFAVHLARMLRWRPAGPRAG